MFLRFSCNGCQKALRVPDASAGLMIRCPHCETVQQAPTGAPATPPHRTSHEDDFRDEPMSRPMVQIDPEELIDMTAMVDIVFFLLIFFLVTSMAGVHSSMPLPNPEARQKSGGAGPKSVDDLDDDSDFIVVRISRDDVIEVEGVTLQDASELPFRLRQLRNSGGGATGLLVVGHGLATHGTAVAALDAGYDAEFEKVRLAVTDEQAE